MSARLNQNFDYLRVLCKCNKRQREGIINGANKELINTICECVDNILEGNVKLTNSQYTKLRRYQSVLRELRDKRTPINRKRETIVQHGGFLSALLAPIIAIAGSLIGDAVGGLIRKK